MKTGPSEGSVLRFNEGVNRFMGRITPCKEIILI